eukprot:3932529-Rhodomonas_salina.1
MAAIGSGAAVCGLGQQGGGGQEAAGVCTEGDSADAAGLAAPCDADVDSEAQRGAEAAAGGGQGGFPLDADFGGQSLCILAGVELRRAAAATCGTADCVAVEAARGDGCFRDVAGAAVRGSTGQTEGAH